MGKTNLHTTIIIYIIPLFYNYGVYKRIEMYSFGFTGLQTINHYYTRIYTL